MLRLRRVHEEDCRLIWEWANDPNVRAVSFSSEPIQWEEHVKWFKLKVNDSRCLFYIAINNDDVAIGQLRYSIKDNNEATISISIDPKFRGYGYGSKLIRTSSEEILNVSNISVIHAYIKEDNEASIRAFKKAGYGNIGRMIVNGHQVIHLAFRRGN
jgi:UDP-2,4-diacetamido-2,4,6-trideoxy-beta-L-altropyranose hydrolase